MCNAIRVVWAGNDAPNNPYHEYVDMLIEIKRWNVAAYLPPLLLPSMYVLKLCYVVLKLEVNNSVAGGDFFPVLFRLVNLILNIWTCKTYWP